MNYNKKQQPQRTNNEDWEDDIVPQSSFQVVGKPLAMSYETNVDETFIHPRQFASLVYILENAGENDHLTINLATGGGALHAVLPILGAMKNTLAHVHVHAASDVASAGTFLLMNAHSVSINDYVTIMCHQCSFGSQGDSHSVETQVVHTAKTGKKLLREIYEDFFSTKEIDAMLTGTTIYLDRDQFIEHYESRMEKREKAQEAAMDEMFAEAEELVGEELKPKRKPRKKTTHKGIEKDVVIEE